MGLHVLKIVLSMLCLGSVVPEIDGFLVTCYYNSPAMSQPYPWTYKISDIPLNNCDYLMYAFVTLNSETSEVQVHDHYRDVEQGGFRDAVSYKYVSPKTKVLISLGGWNEGARKYSDMVSDDSSRQIFVRSIVEFIDKYNFDGLDLDWEYPAFVDGGGRLTDNANFIKLLMELRAKFNPRGWKLTAAVSVYRPLVKKAYNCPRMAELLDLVNVMAYDMRGTFSNAADVHSPLFHRPFDRDRYTLLNTQESMNTWVACGMPRHKIILGIPFYGGTFTLADPAKWKLNSPIVGKGRSTPVTREEGFVNYNEICTMKKTGNCKSDRDGIGRVPYLVCGDQWIGYEDEESVREKTSYAKSQGYGGVMMWSVDKDDLRGECGKGVNPLMRTIMSVISN